MLAIPAGVYRLGGEGGECIIADGEGPIREVYVDGFLMDATAVTNQQFARFVEHTGYVTEAEALGWSFVFAGLLRRGTLCLEQGLTSTPWWHGVPGASWRRPVGPASSYDEVPDHPVVHVSWNDAATYAQWAGKALPTEAQWEAAARGASIDQIFPWGDSLEADGKHRCNVWQGLFPTANSAADGFTGTAPARSFEPNGFGLFNMLGNVWEWCADWWSVDWHHAASRATRYGPRGPEQGEAKVIRGGSYLCHASYCNRYRLSSRSCNTPVSSTGHTGFRCVLE
jgi:formylglycine-generating enzyme required for sulfatase activity